MAKKKPKRDRKNPKANGRPSVYSKELVTELCGIIASTDMGVHRICKKHKQFPAPAQIFKWLLDFEDKDKDHFREQYAYAKDIQTEFMNDKMNETAAPKKADKRGFGVGNQIINRDKLIVDTLKWQMSKLAPKKWGERMHVDQTIRTEQPLFPDIEKDKD